ncbi:hypothetical protein Cob_v002399 [Colletotrichum orbiculare MAFF 240422]|uniref:Uncharacterized protein n=1 Tax=Colletotrichum orbiculare (strain 104-T / ATCC 96160 / CBS 514.97 / LARS 414 / MAFF 240422) TaxID=1213857 RepID=N4VBX1_COLOR|nr:hypothetical protein Cob_v002399 [Colletotrichum orbiculare MAFF 240422]
MPTSTLSQYAINNVGPLTTVFTAPESCVTPPPDLHLAFSQTGVSEANFTNPFWRKTCGPALYGDCYPSGSQIDAAWASASEKGFSDFYTIDYFSPASACPDAYTTVGLAVKGANGEVESSGAFVPPVVTGPAFIPHGPMYNPPLNLLMEALEKGETAVMCCPASYSHGINGDCYSRVPDSAYGEKTACEAHQATGDYTLITRTFTYNDTAYTGGIYSYTASSQSYSTSTRTLEPLISNLCAVAWRPGVTMIHKADETGTARTTAASGTAASTESLPSAASGSRSVASGGVGLMAAVWGLATLAGAVLAVPL